MITWQAINVAVLATLISGCSMASEEPQRSERPSPEFIGEVIVKFSNDQQINTDIVESMKESGIPSRDVNLYASRLSDQIGVPFEASRITSGRELILEVRSDALLADLAKKMSQRPEIADSRRSTDERSSPYRRDEVLILFERDSSQFRTLQNIRPTMGRPGPDVINLAESLTKDIGYPVTPRVLPTGELALSVDTNALTQELVDKLKKRDDVAYAQPNFVMKYN